MSAAKQNLVIDQGADWFITFTYKDAAGLPINLTGFSSKMQLRTNHSDSVAVLSLSSGEGMTIDSLLGKISVHATATQTGAIAFGDYFYDLEITSSGGVVTRLIEGRISVSPQVTR
jgi:hypothetical protein